MIDIKLSQTPDDMGTLPKLDLLSNLRGIESGKRVFILGSSPTLSEFDAFLDTYDIQPQDDFILAVNNSWRIFEELKIPLNSCYFVTGHNGSFESRDFYKKLPLELRKIVPLCDGLKDPNFFPDKWERIRFDIEQQLYNYSQEREPGYASNDFSIEGIKLPKREGFFSYLSNSFYNYDPPDRETAKALARQISPNQHYIIPGGTSVGVAIQLALVMGANTIDLFGVSFNNSSPNQSATTLEYNQLNYDKRVMPPSLEGGRTNFLQQIFLEAVIERMRELEVSVQIHGYSKLFSGNKN